MSESVQVRKCDADRLQVGDRLSRIQYYEIIEVDETRENFTVQNEQGFKFKVTRGIIQAEMVSASQYEREEKVSRTELVEKLEGAGDTCFTVVFHKQATDKQVADLLADLEGKDLSTDRGRRALARELLHGEERALVGYLKTAEPKMGRSLVVDLEVSGSQHNLRMVDHRTIKSLILKNVRYHCE